MPEEPETPATPRRHRPRLSDLAGDTLENELWNLDDDSEPSHPEVEVRPRKHRAEFEQSDTSEPDVPAAEETDFSAGEKVEAPAEAPIEPRASKKTTSSKAKHDFPLREREGEIELEEGEASTGDSSKPAAAPAPAAESLPEAESAEAPATEETTEGGEAEATAPASGNPPAKLEKIGLISLGGVLLGIGIWWLTGLLSSVRTTNLDEGFPDLPAKGEFTEISNIVSFWRKPVREGASADVATADTVYIPVVEITLEESQSGVLRVIFRDSEGNFIGDTITRSFSGGNFNDTGSDTAEFAATDGFHQASAFNDYRVGDDRWTAEIFEGPSVNAAGSRFTQILTTPLFPKQR